MAKRNNNLLNISDALKNFVTENNLEKGLDKVNVRDAWAKLMGNGINKYTTAIELKKDILYVQLSSSALREELSYGNQKIITLLNEELGKDVIKKLKKEILQQREMLQDTDAKDKIVLKIISKYWDS